MPFEALVDPGDKLLGADNAAVGEIPDPVTKSVNAGQIKACPVQFTCDSEAYFTGANSLSPKSMERNLSRFLVWA